MYSTQSLLLCPSIVSCPLSCVVPKDARLDAAASASDAAESDSDSADESDIGLIFDVETITTPDGCCRTYSDMRGRTFLLNAPSLQEIEAFEARSKQKEMAQLFEIAPQAASASFAGASASSAVSASPPPPLPRLRKKPPQMQILKIPPNSVRVASRALPLNTIAEYRSRIGPHTFQWHQAKLLAARQPPPLKAVSLLLAKARRRPSASTFPSPPLKAAPPKPASWPPQTPWPPPKTAAPAAPKKKAESATSKKVAAQRSDFPPPPIKPPPVPVHDFLKRTYTPAEQDDGAHLAAFKSRPRYGSSSLYRTPHPDRHAEEATRGSRVRNVRRRRSTRGCRLSLLDQSSAIKPATA